MGEERQEQIDFRFVILDFGLKIKGIDRGRAKEGEKDRDRVILDL